MTSDALISPEGLAAILGEPDVLVVEVSFLEPDVAPYFVSHVPGARYAYWKDLLWHETTRDFAEPDVLARRLGSLGVGEQTRLVLMGDRVQMGTYAYWVLHRAGLLGHVSVLDGGRRTWQARGLPLTSKEVRVSPSTLRAGVGDASTRISREEVLAGLGDARRVILDMRSFEEYTGQRVAPLGAPCDHGAERRGHIPGALSLPHERLLGADGSLLAPRVIRETLAELGVEETSQVVTTCRLGHRAAFAWFVLSVLLERRGVRVYDGSWTEWGSIVGVPIER